MNTDGSALTPQQLAAENAAHDRLIRWLVFITLAIVSAYPVGAWNPDARLYLAAGRLIVQGEHRYGSDPFAYGAHQPQGWAWLQRFLGTVGLGPKQLDWVNTGWLAEVCFYLIYAASGGTGLVALRVLLTLGITGFIWRAALQMSESGGKFSVRQRHAGQMGSKQPTESKNAGPPFAPWLALGMLLTGLTVCMRLHIRPESLGLLYLACLLAMLTEPPVLVPASPNGGPFWRKWWQQLLRLGRGRLWCLIPALFFLWANTDGTVVLGIVVLLLYWVGQHLHAVWGPDRYARDVIQHEDRRLLGRVLAASLLATLINPFHLHVLDPSVLFFPETAAMLESIGGPASRLGISPFSAAYFTQAQSNGFQLNLAELAYFILLVLAGLGWWFDRGHWRWSWFLVTLVGLIMSSYLAKYTAWFAILVLPGAWAHWRWYLAERYGELPRTSRRTVLWSQLGRLAMVGLLVTFMALTLWPRPETGTAAGWITRRGWGFSLPKDNSLEHAAQTARNWQHTGQLPGRALHLGWVQAGAYWSYHNPGSLWLDLRAGLFTRQTVSDFIEVIQALEKTGTAEGQTQRRRWQEILRRYDISHLVVHVDITVPRVDAAKRPIQVPLLPLLLGDRDERGEPVWELLDYLDGETFLLGWRGSEHWPELQSLRFSPLRRWKEARVDAVGTGSANHSIPYGSASVGRDTEPWRTLRTYFTGQTPQVPLSSSAARWAFSLVHDFRQRLASAQQQAEGILLATQLAGWTGSLPMCGSIGMAARYATVLSEGWPTLPRWPRLVYQTDALLWLAWRWARQGLLQAPHHPVAWGICYDVSNLLDSYEAQFADGARHESRLLARMFLLRQLTRLRPDLANAQLELSRSYLERGCDDLALLHAEQFLQLSHSDAADAQAWQKRLEDYLGMSLEQLRHRVAEAQKRFQPILTLLQQPTIIQARPGEVVTGAREMWQARLAGAALTLLQPLIRLVPPSQPEFADAVRLLADIYVQVGDAVNLYRLLEERWAETAFGTERYELFSALTAGALGDAVGEIQHRERLESRLREVAAQSFLQGATQLALGGDIGPAGSFFHGLFLQQQALNRSRERVLNLLAIASANLEAGQLSQARMVFARIREVAPRELFVGLADHYLRVLPTD